MKTFVLLLSFTGLVPGVLGLLRPVGHGYYVIMTKATWPVAQNYCRETYEDLATIESQLDWLRLKTEIARKALTDPAWIGLKSDINSWRWTFNDVYLKNAFQPWYPDQPGIGGREPCGLSGPFGFWWDYPCTNLFPFICYNANNSKANKFVGVNSPMTWNGAKDYCRTFHTDLAIVTSAEDNSAMQVIAGHQGASWLGLYRDTWKWSDGTKASNVQWLSGQPDNYYHSENCGVFDGAMFQDTQCNGLNYFICQITQPAREKQILKMQVKSDVSVFNSDVQRAILELIKKKLEENNMLKNTKVTWRVQPDGHIFRKKKN